METSENRNKTKTKVKLLIARTSQVKERREMKREKIIAIGEYSVQQIHELDKIKIKGDI